MSGAGEKTRLETENGKLATVLDDFQSKGLCGEM
jgi:hypothetical protein